MDMKFLAQKAYALALVICCAAGTVAAAITPVNTTGDSSTWLFKDSQTGLTWTNGNAFPATGLTFADASAAAASLGTGWRLPTYAEFFTLYQDLGQVEQASITSLWGGVFTTNGVQYWTSTPTSTDSALIRYFIPQNPMATGESFHAKNLKVTTWAVTSVPEPEQWAMLLAGLVLMGFAAKRRKGKQA
jgi:hypothetical protein